MQFLYQQKAQISFITQQLPLHFTTQMNSLISPNVIQTHTSPFLRRSWSGLLKWEEDLDTFIMWVYGLAGSRKSVIIQTITEMCKDEMILLVSFFFSKNNPSHSTVKPLIATISYQIILNLPEVWDAILEAITHNPLIFSKSLRCQVKSLIVAPLQLLVEAGFFNLPNCCHLVIINGLDECSDPQVQQNILQVIAMPSDNIGSH